jgi:hypothetical protein
MASTNDDNRRHPTTPRRHSTNLDEPRRTSTNLDEPRRTSTNLDEPLPGSDQLLQLRAQIQETLRITWEQLATIDRLIEEAQARREASDQLIGEAQARLGDTIRLIEE